MVANQLNQIDQLLEQSTKLYLQRSLDKALPIAMDALHLAMEENRSEGIIKAHLLLGRIYNTIGYYRGDQSMLAKAQEQIEKVAELNLVLQNEEIAIDLLLVCAKIHQNKLEYDIAAIHLEKALKLSHAIKNTKAEVRSLCALSQLRILENDFEKALDHARFAEKLITEPDSDAAKPLIAAVYNQLAQIYRKKRQEYSSILKYSRQVLKISLENGDIEKELKSLNNIAIVHGVQSDYKSAMQYFLQELAKSKAVKFYSNTAQCLINIGTIYANLYNYEDAIIRYENVLDEYGSLLDNNTEIIVYNNLGNIYYKTDRFKQAESFFEKALNLAEQCNYREMVAQSLAQLSRTRTAQKDFDSALVHADKAHKLIQTLGEVNGKQINLINLGDIHFQRGELDKAMVLTSQGIVAAKRMGDAITEMRGYQLLSKIHEQKKDFEKALDYQVIYAKAQKNFFNEQRNRQIIDLEIKNAITEKQKEIEQLTKENEFQALLLKQSDQIADQNAQLLAANDELRQFAYVASHDLKEPLRMIGSYIQLIHRLHADQFTEESKAYFEFVSEGAVRMNNLLDALLRYATIGKTEEEREVVDLKDVVDIAIINLRVSIEETQAVINCKNLPIVYSTQSLLIQLFQNLLSNAIKFRNPEKPPEITIVAEDHPDEVVISIKDQGIGIAPEYQERIFVIFQRLHSRSKYEGTGIGLAICQKIMQRLGGRIWLDSKADEGANFFIAIPKKKEKRKEIGESTV